MSGGLVWDGMNWLCKRRKLLEERFEGQDMCNTVRVLAFGDSGDAT